MNNGQMNNPHILSNPNGNGIIPNKLKPKFDDLNNAATFVSHTSNLITETKQKNNGLFKIRTANEWIEDAKSRPIPKMLFDEYWYEGELCILFADTNVGKSILAVQIGNSISKCKKIHGFKCEAEKQPILYFDFELSDKQFEGRYSEKYKNHLIFDNNFLRVEIDDDTDIPEDKISEEFLFESIERSINNYKAKVLIIDNITYLKNETEKARNALPLMKHLKTLKSKYGLSILVLAHTPKRDLSKPITRNDLAGSKMLMNFCDSAFTIGESNEDKNFRYLKQIKTRHTEKRYDSENVMVCEIKKPDNFLQLHFIKYGTESEHLRVYSKKDKEVRIAEVLELKKQGISNVEIAQMYGVTEGAIRKWVKKKKL
jgi:AAA domain-containing protein